MVLQGPAHKTVFDMSRRNATLNEILDMLENLYVKKRTVLDDMREINNFKRKANEPLLTAMSRARLLLEKVKHMYSPISWAEKLDTWQINILKQIVSPATRKHIDAEETAKLRMGLPPDYATYLELADTYESSNNEIPQTETATVVGVYTGVLAAPEVSDPKTEILQSKISNLESIVLTALDPTDKRSLKTRTKSRDRTKDTSRERSKKGLFERHMKQYAKLEDEEKKQTKTTSSTTPSRSSSTYSESGYDRKRNLRKSRERDKKDAKTIDKYLSRSKSTDSEPMDTSSRSRHNRSSSRYGSRSRDRYRSRDRSRSRDRRNRSSSYRSDRSSSRSNQNYHERERSRSYDKKKNNYRNRSPNYDKKKSNKYDNKKSKNYDNKNGPKRSLNKKEIYENYQKLSNKRHGPNGELTGFTIQNHYYIQCTRPSCQQAHLEGTKCNLN